MGIDGGIALFHLQAFFESKYCLGWNYITVALAGAGGP
jgi:hypothetical protein